MDSGIPYDSAVDMWSLGVVLHSVLSNPYPNPTLTLALTPTPTQVLTKPVSSHRLFKCLTEALSDDPKLSPSPVVRHSPLTLSLTLTTSPNQSSRPRQWCAMAPAASIPDPHSNPNPDPNPNPNPNP